MVEDDIYLQEQDHILILRYYDYVILVHVVIVINAMSNLVVMLY